MTEDTSRQTPLRVVVHLRRRDLLRGQWHLIVRNPIWLIVLIACFGTTIYQLQDSSRGWSVTTSVAISALVAFIFTVGGIVLVHLIITPLMLLRLRNAPGVLGEHTFEVSGEGLREITAFNETRVAPGYARRVFRTRNFLFVLVRPRGTFLLPRHAFADAAAYRDFWNALQPLAAKKEKIRAA